MLQRVEILLAPLEFVLLSLLDFYDYGGLATFVEEHREKVRDAKSGRIAWWKLELIQAVDHVTAIKPAEEKHEVVLGG